MVIVAESFIAYLLDPMPDARGVAADVIAEFVAEAGVNGVCMGASSSISSAQDFVGACGVVALDAEGSSTFLKHFPSSHHNF